MVNVFFFSMNSVLKPKEIFLAKPARIAERFLDQNFFCVIWSNIKLFSGILEIRVDSTEKIIDRLSFSP